MQDEQPIRLFERLSPAEEQGRIAGGERLVQASYLVASCHKASAAAKVPESINRKERRTHDEKIRVEEEIILENWAKQNQCWVAPVIFLEKYEAREIGKGSEAIVYLSYDDVHVIKVNDGAYHGNWQEFFDRLAIHNTLFPETGYVLTGFTQRVGFDGEPILAAILEQLYFETERGATFEEVKINMALMGFQHWRRDDYYNPETGVIVEDLHDENVFMSKRQNLIYIDPAIFLEQPEMHLARKRIIAP